MKVSWGYYSQYMEKIKHVPNHQSEIQQIRVSLSHLNENAWKITWLDDFAKI
jgi:hypothetical protein